MFNLFKCVSLFSSWFQKNLCYHEADNHILYTKFPQFILYWTKTPGYQHIVILLSQVVCKYDMHVQVIYDTFHNYQKIESALRNRGREWYLWYNYISRYHLDYYPNPNPTPNPTFSMRGSLPIDKAIFPFTIVSSFSISVQNPLIPSANCSY